LFEGGDHERQDGDAEVVEEVALHVVRADLTIDVAVGALARPTH
jgi:hypothetical protein